MSDVANDHHGLPKDSVLLAGLAFSVFGLTCAFTLVGNVIRPMVSMRELALYVGLPALVIGYGFAGGTWRRRAVVAGTLFGSWLAFFRRATFACLVQPAYWS
jgi:hypothetical protein